MSVHLSYEPYGQAEIDKPYKQQIYYAPRNAPDSGWLMKMFARMRSVIFLPMRFTTAGSLPW